MSVEPNLGFYLTADEAWSAHLEPPLPNDPKAGWWLHLSANDDMREVRIHFAGWSERDIEAWLLKAKNRVTVYRDGDRGGPTPETLRHAKERRAS